MNKYHAKRCFVDGQWFDSQREAARHRDLRFLEAAGEIRALARQVVYALLVNGIRIGEYRADFTYQEPAKPPQTGWVHIVEDSKGYRNDLYRWKRKHVAAQYGIEIRET